MATPSSALEKVIAQFSQQPGVSSEDVSQLRTALASDPGLTTAMDAAATSGALHGLAPAAPNASNRPLGDYDRTNGIVTLPSSAFTASGLAPSADLQALLRVQSMVIEFGGKSFVDNNGSSKPVTTEMLTNLQDTMNGSPLLADELKRAATTADPLSPQNRILEHFGFTAPGDGVGGSFDAKNHTMNLVSESLANSTPGSNKHYDVHDLTFVIGHEVQHGFNAQAAAQRDDVFLRDVRSLAASRGPIHDYTTLVEHHIQTGRENEAKSEIAGWNALRSRIEHDNGTVTLLTMQKVAPGRVNDFIETRNGQLEPRTNVTLNPDLTMPQTPGNVAAMGYNYYDRPVHPQPGDNRQPMGLGHNNVSDYSNRNAGWAIATINLEEQYASRGRSVKPQVQINMAHAGLDEAMMEKGGLDLKPSTVPLPYLDSSTQPATPHRFDHTADGPNQFQHVPIAPASPLRLDDPSHTDHVLFKQARSHIAALDESLGRSSDQHTDQIASSLAVQARADGLQRIDQVALSTNGDRLWAVQTPPGRTDHLFDLRTSVPTAEAMTPMEQSGAKWPQAMEQFEQTRGQQQAQAQQQQATQEAVHQHTLQGSGMGR